MTAHRQAGSSHPRDQAAMTHSGGSAVVNDSSKQQYDLYHSRVEVFRNLLAAYCPDFKEPARQPRDQYHSDAEAEQAFYRALSYQLTVCQLSHQSYPQPPECENATTFTQPWRKDHDGKGLKPGGPSSLLGRACDERKDLQWFRFRGEAGSRMLDSAPKYESCGSLWPYWTDAEMPTDVGVVKRVEAFGVQDQFPKAYSSQIEVMRCSEAKNDFIYRHTGPYYDMCQSTYCGMD
ncbi:uromodulin-like [Watersipora subatra]|uniref:uromodulin-like n=1 Tax=Watersipora subatra TaxID=2589382 RepID=UPI00355B1DF2